MEWFTPKVIEAVSKLVTDGGASLAVVILLLMLGLEIRRGHAKDKLIAEKDEANLKSQEKMLVLMGEVKTALSNSLLLLELLTRGRK